MAIHYGECVGCGRGNDEKGIRIYDSTDKCVICTRLDKLEKMIGMDDDNV